VPERAVYVVLDAYGWQRYTSRWRARTMDLDLASGPVAALRQIRTEEPTNQWYDDVWCEAAALVDQPHKVLLFFTTHSESYAHRAAVLAALAEAWPGWDVRWAYDGLGDLVAYLGLDRAEVRTEEGMVFEPDPGADDDDQFDQLVSVTREGGETDAYGLALPIGEVLGRGPESVELLPDEARVTACELPRSGVHVDFTTKTIGMWTMDAFRGLADRLSWPGWQLDVWDDRYAEQLDRCEVTVPDWSLADGLRTLLDRARSESNRPNYEPI
jgi:hypothetical protein